MNNNACNLVPVFINLTSQVLRSVIQRGTFLTFSFFLLAFSTLANGLSSQQIENDFRNNPVFQPSAGHSRYQHLSTDFMEQSWSSNIKDLASFYAELELEHKDVLGKPNYVPIGVGDITTIIPIYDKPRFIGSPVIQSRYIREQIRSLLGRNLIDAENGDYANEIAQLNTLYRNAIEFIQYEAVDITYGDNLGLDQTASGLSQDIVWPEFRTINGEKVVVPIVYLTQATYEENRVTEHEINLNGSALFNDLIIDGVKIKLGRDAFLQASSRLRNYGGTLSGAGNLYIAVGGPLENLSGIIESKGNLEIGAHSIDHRTIVHRYDFGRGQGGRFGEIASISSQEGNVELTSYQDILIQGGIVSAPAGSITFSAGGDILIGGVQYYESGASGGRKWSSSYSRTHILQSYLTAEDTISLIAEGGIKIDAAEIVSDQGHIELLAGLGITIEDELTHDQYSYFSKSSDSTRQVESYKTVAMRALLDAGKGIRLHTEYGDITLKAVDISSAQGTTVNASNGGVNLLMTVENDHYAYSSVNEGLFTVSTRSYGRDIETGIYNTIVGGIAVEALSGVRIEYEGFETDESTFRRFGKEKEAVTLEDQINNLSQLQGLEWMALVRDSLPQADWEAVELRYETWNESSTSLSPEMVAVISIAMSFVTPGAGGNLWTTMLNAGAATFETQAVVALANGALNGDLGVAADQLFSDQNLQNLVSSMITAGAIYQIDSTFFTPGEAELKQVANDAAQSALDDGLLEGMASFEARVSQAVQDARELSLGMQLNQMLLHSSAQAGVNTLIYGGGSEEFYSQLLSNLGSSAISMIGREVSTAIGEAARNDDITTAAQYIAHAALGCFTGTLTSAMSEQEIREGCLSGAGGAVIGEYVAESYREELRNDLEGWAQRNLTEYGTYTYAEFDKEVRNFLSRGVDVGRLAAAFTAFVAGTDINIAANAAQTAGLYNANGGGIDFQTTANQFNHISRLNTLRNHPIIYFLSDVTNSTAQRVLSLLGGDDPTTWQEEFESNPTLYNALTAAADQGLQNAEANVKAMLAFMAQQMSFELSQCDCQNPNPSDLRSQPPTELELINYKYRIVSSLRDLHYAERDRIHSLNDLQNGSEFGSEALVEYNEKRVKDLVYTLVETLFTLRTIAEPLGGNIIGTPVHEAEPQILINIPPDIAPMLVLVKEVMDEELFGNIIVDPIPDDLGDAHILIYPLPDVNPLDNIMLSENAGQSEVTQEVVISGEQSKQDMGQEYDMEVNFQIYGGQASEEDRKFTTIKDGQFVNHVADNIVVIDSEIVVIENKFVYSWSNSIYNPNNFFAQLIGEIEDTISQAEAYQSRFDNIRYHTNSVEFAEAWGEYFKARGWDSIEIVITPAKLK